MGEATMTVLRHFTNRAGHNGINSAKIWRFIASKPPCEHPIGAYFTDYAPDTVLLARKLRIPKEKTEFVFAFHDVDDLQPIDGGRGRHIFFSKADYFVDEPRQLGIRRREVE